MQQTSQLWKDLWAAGASLETRATINGAAYVAMEAPVINRAIMQDDVSIGNAVSANCSLTIRTEAADVIPRGAEVLIEMRLVGAVESEWRPAGTFYIASRQRDPVTGLLRLNCYDAMLKANALYYSTPGSYLVKQDGTPIVTETGAYILLAPAWPRAMAYVAEQISFALGVPMDGRTVLQTGADYMMDEPDDGASIHDLLSQIAAANGGNWTITPENKLRLVPVLPATGTAAALDVPGIVGEITTSPLETITGIKYPTDDGETLIGDKTGGVIEANVSAAVAQTLATWIIGRTYQPFAFRGAIYDPAAELGDVVERLGVTYGAIETETAHLGAAYWGDISAPEADELADEYPYVSPTEKQIEEAQAAAAQAKTTATQANTTANAANTTANAASATASQANTTANAASTAVAALDTSLNQQGVFNRLTNNGQTQGIYLENGRVYINADYIATGTLKLGGLNNQRGRMEIYDETNALFSTFDNDGLFIGNADDNVQLYVPDAEFGGRRAFYCKSVYDAEETVKIYTEVFVADGKLYARNTNDPQEVAISSAGFAYTYEEEVTGEGGTAETITHIIRMGVDGVYTNYDIEGKAFYPSDPATSRANFGIRSGFTEAVSVSAGGYADINLTWAALTAVEPHVVVSFMTASTAGAFGRCSCSVVPGTATATGCKVRIFNGDSSTRAPRVSWIAMG